MPAAALENIPFVGLFFPGEVIVTAAGFFAARGELDFAVVVILAALGGVIGNGIGYAMGFWGGRPLLERLAVRFHVDKSVLNHADDYFQRHGPKTVFIGRYLAGLKALIAALAGVARMDVLLFFLYSSAGVITWTLLAVSLGYFFGSYFNVVMGIIKTIGWGSLIIFLAIIGAWFYRRRRRREVDDA